MLFLILFFTIVPSAVPVVQPSFFSCIAPECSEIQIYWQVLVYRYFSLKYFRKKIYSTVRTVSLLNFVFVFCFAYKPIKEEDNRCDMMRYKVEPVSPKSPHSRPVFAAEDSVSARLPLNTNATVQISVVPFNEKTNEFPLMEPSMLVIPPKSQCKFFLNDDMLKFKVFICLFSWRDAFSSIIHFWGIQMNINHLER